MRNNERRHGNTIKNNNSEETLIRYRKISKINRDHAHNKTEQTQRNITKIHETKKTTVTMRNIKNTQNKEARRASHENKQIRHEQQNNNEHIFNKET